MDTFKKYKNMVAAVLLLLICLFSYSNALNSDFLLDDYRYLIGEKNAGTISFSDLLTKPHHGHYRPVGRFFLKLSVMTMGDNANAYHIFHLIMFYGICILFYFIVFELFASFELALLVSCLFAAHPIHNMLVNYKTSIGFCINLLFMQASVLCLLRYVKQKYVFPLLISLLLYLLCLLIHEISFMLPVYLFVILHLKRAFSLKKNILICFTYLVPLIIYLLMRIPVMGMTARDTYQEGSILALNLSLNQYIFSVMQVAGWYLTKLISPVNILLIWDEPLTKNISSPWPVLSMMAAVIIYFIVFFKMKKNVFAFGLCLFLPGFLPLFLASFTYTAKTQTAIIEPHWLVFPSIGFFLIVAAVLLFIKERSNTYICAVLAVAMITGLIFLTRKSNTVWKDPTTYCTFWMEQNPHNATAYSCRAKEDIRKLDQGLNPEKYQNCDDAAFLGGAYNLIQERQKTLQYYQLALDMDSGCTNAYLGLGILYLDIKEYNKAELNLRKAIFIDPHFTPAYSRLLEVYKIQGKFKEADQIKAILNQ